MSKSKPLVSFAEALGQERSTGKEVKFRGWGDPAGEACLKFRDTHKHVSAASLDPLYAMPQPLLEAICTHVPNWLTQEEVDFERALLAFCQSLLGVGIVDNSPVHCMLLDPPPPLTLSEEEVAFLKSHDPDRPAKEPAADSMPPDPAAAGRLRAEARMIEETAEKRLTPWRDLAKAYLGWLLTKSEFVRELAVLREHRQRRSHWRSFEWMPNEKPDPDLRTFLDRWQLTAFASWDLPQPQGPNLTGVPWPSQVLGAKATIRIEVPITAALASDYEVLQSVEEMRDRQCPPHLREWIEVIQRLAKRHTYSLGLTRLSHMFMLQFYRHTVLGRYASRIVGRVQQLDRAFGDFLGVGDDETKRLRLAIHARLKDDSTA